MPFLEYLEEIIPGNWIESFVGFLEVDPQNTAFAVGPHDGWAAASFFCPFPDFIMVGCGFRLCHLSLHTDASPEY